MDGLESFDGPPVPFLTPEELALLPHDDRGPLLLAASWGMTGAATFFLVLRIYCKNIGRRGLAWDDWILIASWVLMAVNCALLTKLVVVDGFGKHSWDFFPRDFQAFFLTLQVRATFAVTAIVWTKSAFAVTLLRLCQGWWKRLIWFILISMNIAMGISGTLSWIQCKPIEKSWNPFLPGACWDIMILVRYGIFAGSYSAAMDFILALMPWKVIWGLQMKKREKAGVAICMSFGIFAGVTAIMKTINLPKLVSSDLYDTVEIILWDIAEASVSMIAICIPILRALIPEVKANMTRGYNITKPSTTLTKKRMMTTSSRTLRSMPGSYDSYGKEMEAKETV